ncbi:MAG: DNA methylase [Armatimonadetes bacterium]|nr:DNA methylase [Armatimonadota bacterium]
MSDLRRRKSPEFSDIDLSRWKDYGDLITDSLWLLGPRDKSGPHVGDYHGNFVPQIAQQVIRRFTRPGEVVVDLFSGMGTTLIECRHLGRHGIGVELQAPINQRAGERIEQALNPNGIETCLITGDSRLEETRRQVQAQLERLGCAHAHHVVLHPPYWDIIQFSEGDDERDLSALGSQTAFYESFGQVADQARRLLRPGRFLTLIIGDKYSQNEWIPLGFECMQICRNLGLRLKAVNVKDIQGNEKGKGKSNNLWRYRALRNGFYIFKHEYVMIFQRPQKDRA